MGFVAICKNKPLFILVLPDSRAGCLLFAFEVKLKDSHCIQFDFAG
jgi:hypothetical protein